MISASSISVLSPGAYLSMNRPESPVVGAYRSRNAQWVPLTTRKSPRQLSCVVAKNLRQGHVSVFVFGVSFPVGERTPSWKSGCRQGVSPNAPGCTPDVPPRGEPLAAPFPRGRRLTQNRRRRNARRDSGCPRSVSGKLQVGARGPCAICMQRVTPPWAVYLG